MVPISAALDLRGNSGHGYWGVKELQAGAAQMHGGRALVWLHVKLLLACGPSPGPVNSAAL